VQQAVNMEKIFHQFTNKLLLKIAFHVIINYKQKEDNDL